MKSANAPRADPSNAPIDSNPHSTRSMPQAALANDSIPAANESRRNDSTDVNKPLNMPVRLHRKRVRAMGRQRSRLSILRKILISGENNIGTRAIIRATAIPSLTENEFIFPKSIPAIMPDTLARVIAVLKIPTGLDKAIMRAYKTLNSA